MASPSLDPRLYRRVLLNLAGVAIVFIVTLTLTTGPPTVLDSCGIVVCLPLVAYIVHIIILEYRDWRSGRE